MPELEAAPEPRESDVSASEGRPGPITPGAGEAVSSWWHRLFYWQ